ncbi:MAG: hypothetical protein R3F61_08060 [Myxococcota bacterium]
MRILFVVALVSGCVRTGGVRAAASQHLGCPKRSIDVEVDVISELSGRPISVRAIGCGDAVQMLRLTGGTHWQPVRLGVRDVPRPEEPVPVGVSADGH